MIPVSEKPQRQPALSLFGQRLGSASWEELTNLGKVLRHVTRAHLFQCQHQAAMKVFCQRVAAGSDVEVSRALDTPLRRAGKRAATPGLGWCRRPSSARRIGLAGPRIPNSWGGSLADFNFPSKA